MAHSRLGDLDVAETLARRTLEILRATLGDDHFALAFPLRELGAIEFKRGNRDEGRRLIKQALEIEEGSLGADHPDLVWTLRLTANTLARSGDYDGAAAVYDRALSIVEKGLGPLHAEVAATLESKALMEVRRNQLVAARRLMERAQEIRPQVLPATDPRIGVNYYDQACIAALKGDRRTAFSLLNQALATDWVDPFIFDDPDLDSLRDDPEFRSIRDQVHAKLNGLESSPGSVALDPGPAHG
jgi:tetratricopeptide (TPR) repeat protein